MEVHVSPELEAKLNEMAIATGRAINDLLQDAVTGYFDELVQVRSILDARYDDIKNSRVKAIDGEEFFETLRQRESRLTKADLQQ